MFNRFLIILQRAFRDEKAQGALEYVAIVVGFVVIIVGGFNFIGKETGCAVKNQLCDQFVSAPLTCPNPC
jgi:hypothetical protein